MRTTRGGAAWLAVVVATAGSWAQEPDEPERMRAETFQGLELRGIGPALMSGRIADIAVHPKDTSTWYVAVGSGGLWKTTNAGTTWTPIFDDQPSYSLGCVTIDPRHPDTIWVGTGENVGGRHVGYGDGVYRSRDGGASWTRVGLETSEHIGRILVDPRDSDVVWVAAQGPLWSGGGERGLYKTTDGGASWTRVLGGGEYTGVTDVVLDPRDPDVLYAATHQRLRSVAALIDGGPDSGIHKSTDGGASWHELTSGLPEEDLGRIGLAISPQNPDVLYATIELAHREGGVWRSADAGASWEKRSDYAAGGTGPHYYQELFASPHQFDRIYHMDVRLHVSEDGGTTFRSIDGPFKHVDNHAMAFDPADPDYLLVGCDGGIYQSWDLGETWRFTQNLPVTQFYKVAVDYDLPFYNVYGGTQDNNTQGGPSRTDNVHGIRNSDWFITLGGDGHQPAVDPTNPDIVYSEWQQGNLVRHDRKTGENVYIQPQPAADEPWERFNWDAPILISPHDPARLFFASQRVWRSDDRGDSWTPISADLTRGLDRLTLPLMERVWSYDAVWDLYAMSKYGTITSLAQSPLDDQLIYVGTDDGLIQITEDGGASWRRVDRLPGLPEKFFVNDVKADLHDADTVYVVVDRHKDGDFEPYLFRSPDRGRTWTPMTGDLPERHLLWRLVQDHVDPELFFLGTEFGVYFTVDRGERWIELTGGVPNVPFRDLVIQTRESDLVGATFGRGFFVLDDYSPLRHLDTDTLAQDAVLFPVRPAAWYQPRRTLGSSKKASQGDAFYVAPNPPFGAVFTYYLRESPKTRQQRRREAEKEAVERGEGTPYPGWDALRDERLEQAPSVVLTVSTADGDVVRHIEAPSGSGFQRVAWDLRHPSYEPWSRGSGSRDGREPRGPFAPPGRYVAQLSRTADGVTQPLGEAVAFEVVPLRTGTLAGAPPDEVGAYTREVIAIQKDVRGALAALDAGRERGEAILDVLSRSTVAGTELADEARAIVRELSELRERMAGVPARSRMGDPGPVSIQQRLWVAEMGAGSLTYGPTETHRASLAIAREQSAEARAALGELLDERLVGLEAKLDAADVPWTPGRSVP